MVFCRWMDGGAGRGGTERTDTKRELGRERILAGTRRREIKKRERKNKRKARHGVLQMDGWRCRGWGGE